MTSAVAPTYTKEVNVCLVRQRPAIGDMLLLAPLVQALKTTYRPKKITIITDAAYAAGALVEIAKGIPGVDAVENVSVLDWTTDSNRLIDSHLPTPSHWPPTVRKADMLLDCNGAFMQFEREHQGNTVPYGIAEFWLRHFNLFTLGQRLLPKYTVTAQARRDVTEWLGGETKPLLGIVLKSGDRARDWDFGERSRCVATWAVSNGMRPVSIDSVKKLEVMDGISCVGRRISFVAALLERCTLTLTPDSGLLHLAQAVGCPTVALFGIVKPELRVGGYDCKIVPAKSHGFCPLHDSSCQCYWKFQQWSCLRRITLQETLQAIEHKLSDIRKGSGNLQAAARE